MLVSTGKLKAMAVGSIVVVIGFGAWFVRPLVQKVRGAGNGTVAFVQTLEHVRVDSTRRYAELSEQARGQRDPGGFPGLVLDGQHFPAGRPRQAARIEHLADADGIGKPEGPHAQGEGRQIAADLHYIEDEFGGQIPQHRLLAYRKTGAPIELGKYEYLAPYQREFSAAIGLKPVNSAAER